MLLKDVRPLIVEAEYLIAADIQRVLEDAATRPPVLARDYQDVALLDQEPSAFDLAVVTPPRPGTDDDAVAARLVAAGVALVVCSAARIPLAGTALAGAELLDKPFADDELIAACLRALAKRAS
ncbi:MAG TPA: hypothetical protein VG966_11165 [Hyphomicrobiaceae bacterium]|nr:hypothetical protein [Hyphomicrobiaceae bacterium]